MSKIIDAHRIICAITEAYAFIPGVNHDDLEIARLRALEQILDLDLSAYQTVLLMRDPSTGGKPQFH